MVRFQNHKWSSRFETYTSFNTDDGITNVYITTHTKWTGNFLQRLNGFNRIAVTFSVYTNWFTFFKFDFYYFTCSFGYLCRPGRFRKVLIRSKRFFSAY